MASIYRRNNSYAVIYNTFTVEGLKKQKWETYHSENEALERKAEIEGANLFLGVRPRIKTLNGLLDEYIKLYGSVTWSASTYASNVSLIDHYIRPYIGKMSLASINTRTLARFFQKSGDIPKKAHRYKPNAGEYISQNTKHELLKILKSTFTQAIYWGYLTFNPAQYIRLPKSFGYYRRALKAQQVLHVIKAAIENQDLFMTLMIQFAFSCSMRKGEILGLQWRDIDFQENTIRIHQELTRLSRSAMKSVSSKGIKLLFPSMKLPSTTQLVLKEPKTASSVRTVYMTPTLNKLLHLWKDRQRLEKAMHACEATDYGLVFAQANGRPFQEKSVSTKFKQLLEKCHYEPVTFHSLRHTSASLLLKAGMQLTDVMHWLGHKNFRTTQRYSHLEARSKTSSTQALTKLIFTEE
jgi:integrase